MIKGASKIGYFLCETSKMIFSIICSGGIKNYCHVVTPEFSCMVYILTYSPPPSSPSTFPTFAPYPSQPHPRIFELISIKFNTIYLSCSTNSALNVGLHYTTLVYIMTCQGHAIERPIIWFGAFGTNSCET